VHLTRLALTDFRNYAAVDLRLAPGVSVFSGGNGQGKTNLLEAVAYVATFGSHRVSTDAPLVRQGAERAILRAAVASAPPGDPAAGPGSPPGGPGAPQPGPDDAMAGSRPGAAREILVEIEVNAGRANRVRLNRVPQPRPREVLGTLQCVLLVATRPRFAGIRADYERVVRQRTALLKSARAQRSGLPDSLEVWDEHLVTLGAELTAGRLDLMAAISPLAGKAYASVGGEGDVVTMSYRQAGQTAQTALPSPGPADRAALADGLRQALARARRAELERAVCLVGPHRDQLELTIGELPARGYASHGESWSLALALRIGAYDLLRSGGDDPVLLLDDVFAELDDGRRERLADLAGGAEQVLVTAAVPADVPGRLAGNRYWVSAGEVRDA
jgi:DNA replication and repair protein RecF